MAVAVEIVIHGFVFSLSPKWPTRYQVCIHCFPSPFTVFHHPYHADTIDISPVVPARNDPDASAKLSRRNSANRQAYEALTDDQNEVFTSRIFFALGGYPDYSAISVADHQDSGDFEVLIPEVPKLTVEEEKRFRPLYEDLVDSAKVKIHREHFKAPTTGQMEKRSLQAFKKRVNQVCLLPLFNLLILPGILS